MICVLVICSIIMVPLSESYSSGLIPQSACTNMSPGHPSTAQTSEPPYSIMLRTAHYIPGLYLEVSLEGSAENSFRGFYCQGRTEEDQTVGIFEGVDDITNARGHRCSTGMETQYDTVSHNVNWSRDPQSRLGFRWRTSPTTNSTRIALTCSFVQSYNIFWVMHQSSFLMSLPSTTALECCIREGLSGGCQSLCNHFETPVEDLTEQTNVLQIAASADDSQCPFNRMQLGLRCSHWSTSGVDDDYYDDDVVYSLMDCCLQRDVSDDCLSLCERNTIGTMAYTKEFFSTCLSNNPGLSRCLISPVVEEATTTAQTTSTTESTTSVPTTSTQDSTTTEASTTTAEPTQTSPTTSAPSLTTTTRIETTAEATISPTTTNRATIASTTPTTLSTFSSESTASTTIPSTPPPANKTRPSTSTTSSTFSTESAAATTIPTTRPPPAITPRPSVSTTSTITTDPTIPTASTVEQSTAEVETVTMQNTRPIIQTTDKPSTVASTTTLPDIITFPAIPGRSVIYRITTTIDVTGAESNPMLRGQVFRALNSSLLSPALSRITGLFSIRVGVAFRPGSLIVDSDVIFLVQPDNSFPLRSVVLNELEGQASENGNIISSSIGSSTWPVTGPIRVARVGTSGSCSGSPCASSEVCVEIQPDGFACLCTNGAGDEVQCQESSPSDLSLYALFALLLLVPVIVGIVLFIVKRRGNNSQKSDKNNKRKETPVYINPAMEAQDRPIYEEIPDEKKQPKSRTNGGNLPSRSVEYDQATPDMPKRKEIQILEEDTDGYMKPKDTATPEESEKDKSKEKLDAESNQNTYDVAYANSGQEREQENKYSFLEREKPRGSRRLDSGEYVEIDGLEDNPPPKYSSQPSVTTEEQENEDTEKFEDTYF